MRLALISGALALTLLVTTDHPPATAQGANVVTPVTAPNAMDITATAVTCGATSTAFGVTGSYYLKIQVPPTATQTVWFGWGTTAATTSTPSEGYTAGTDVAWGGGTGSCIVATGSQSITVLTR